MKWISRTISTEFEAGVMPLLFAAAHGIAVACGQRVRFPVKSPDRLSAVILFALCVLRLTL